MVIFIIDHKLNSQQHVSLHLNPASPKQLRQIKTPNFLTSGLNEYVREDAIHRFLSNTAIKFVQDTIKQMVPWMNPVIQHNGKIRKLDDGASCIDFVCKGNTGSCQNRGLLICKQWGDELKTLIWKMIHSQQYFCQHLHLNHEESFSFENCTILQTENFPSFTDPIKYLIQCTTT